MCPRDVAVTSYDDFRYSTICSPPLTTHRVDVEGMARTAVAQLRRKMAHKPPLAPHGGHPRRLCPAGIDLTAPVRAGQTEKQGAAFRKESGALPYAGQKEKPAAKAAGLWWRIRGLEPQTPCV